MSLNCHFFTSYLHKLWIPICQQIFRVSQPPAGITMKKPPFLGQYVCQGFFSKNERVPCSIENRETSSKPTRKTLFRKSLHLFLFSPGVGAPLINRGLRSQKEDQNHSSLQRLVFVPVSFRKKVGPLFHQLFS